MAVVEPLNESSESILLIMPNVTCGKWLRHHLRRDYDEMSRNTSKSNNNINNKLWGKTRSFKS